MQTLKEIKSEERQREQDAAEAKFTGRHILQDGKVRGVYATDNGTLGTIISMEFWPLEEDGGGQL